MPTSTSDSSHGDERFEREDIAIDIPVQDKVPVYWHPDCCIYKVPTKLRKVNDNAYTPKLISIGPVHRKDNKLEYMQKVKHNYFNEFFSRTWTCKDRKEFESIIEKNEAKIRNCYAPDISLPKNKTDFVEMIVLDSIFIIVLFLKTDERKEDEKDYILSKPWLKAGIRQDLILLENQLPFFILNHLYDQSGCHHKSFLMLACNYFFKNPVDLSNEKKEVKHFTDLYRDFYHPPNLKIGVQNSDQPHTATKLDTAGLIFQKWEPNDNQKHENNPERFLLDIQYKKNLDKKNLKIFPCIRCSWPTDCLKKFLRLKCLQTCIVIPEFTVDDGTEERFRNLMALEQFHYPHEAYICNYIILLDCLINSNEDVELLVDKKIIVNLLGSNEMVAEMINKLCLEIVETNSYYSEIAGDLNKYYKSTWNQNMATLKNVYFRDVWRGTATVVGVVVLLITFLNFLKTFVFQNI
ncbi:hypothetical protein ACB098_11G122100 [Castanea mollissima]